MFDFAWSEIALIGVVALVLIGPKDMPVAIKAVSDMVRKARKMASEFQSHVDEMTKDTGIAEVRQQINEIRNMDIRGEIERAVDADGSIRSTFADDPFRQLTPNPPPAADTALPEADIGERAAHSIERPAELGPQAPPAFIPPSAAPPAPIAAAPPGPPAFIPPAAVRSAVVQPESAQRSETHSDAAGV